MTATFNISSSTFVQTPPEKEIDCLILSETKKFKLSTFNVDPH
jgi:hypothetical protein